MMSQSNLTTDDFSANVDEASQRYAARMVYLTEEDEGQLFGNTALEPMGRTLKPPVLFMSRRQARADYTLWAQRANKSTGGDPLRGVRAQAGEKKPLVTRRNEGAVRGKRKSDNRRAGTSELCLDDKPANWRRVKEAGVAFWFNDVTGVATDECPHESLRSLLELERRRGKAELRATARPPEGSLEVGQEKGTGALVYDSSEFEQTMQILDGTVQGPSSPASVS